MTRIWRWAIEPTHRPLAYLAMGLVLLVGAATAFSVYQRSSERHQRDVAIGLAVRAVQRANYITNEKIYRSALTSCRRDKRSWRLIRSNAQATQKVFDTLDGFFVGARKRAAAQSRDQHISAVSRAAARKSLASIDHAIGIFSAKLHVPSPPPSCLDVIINPNAVTAPQNKGANAP